MPTWTPHSQILISSGKYNTKSIAQSQIRAASLTNVIFLIIDLSILQSKFDHIYGCWGFVFLK